MPNLDWTGNSRSAHATLGASTYSTRDREEHDYYATDPLAAKLLINIEDLSHNIWECACGEGHLSKVFDEAEYNVYSSDLIDRGYGEVCDFLATTAPPIHDCDIVTNPPYVKALEFVEHALDIVEDGHKVAMFLKIQFLETRKRRLLFDKFPPKVIYVCSGRIRCAINGVFDKSSNSSAMCYAWFVWQKGFVGDTVVKWIN